MSELKELYNKEPETVTKENIDKMFAIATSDEKELQKMVLEKLKELMEELKGEFENE